MIYRTNREKIDAYFESENVSQSELKLLAKGIDYYLNNEVKPKNEKYFDEPADHFKIGSAVDCKITEGEEVFNQLYYISTLDKAPSDTVISIIQQVFDTVKDLEGFEPILELHRGDVINACLYHNYQPRWGDDAKFNAIMREGSAYWAELNNAGGRIVLTLEEKTVIDRVVEGLMNHEDFKGFMQRASVDNPEERDVDIFFQVPIYFRHSGVNCKALIDMIVVEHSYRFIRPFDFKSMWDTVSNFPYQSKKRRYDIQGAFYCDAIKDHRNEITEILSANYELEGYPSLMNYSVDGFSFLVQSTTFSNNAVMYFMESELLEMGRKGRPELVTPSINRNVENTEMQYLKVPEIQGYIQLLEKMHNLKNVPEIYGKHPRVMSFDWYGIIE